MLLFLGYLRLYSALFLFGVMVLCFAISSFSAGSIISALPLHSTMLFHMRYAVQFCFALSFLPSRTISTRSAFLGQFRSNFRQAISNHIALLCFPLFGSGFRCLLSFLFYVSVSLVLSGVRYFGILCFCCSGSIFFGTVLYVLYLLLLLFSSLCF